MAKEKQTPINLRERIKVKATDKNPFMKSGEETEAHPIIAREGVKLGHYEIVKKA